MSAADVKFNIQELVSTVKLFTALNASCEVFIVNVLLPYVELGGFHSLAAPLSFEAAESDLQDRQDSWVCPKLSLVCEGRLISDFTQSICSY